MKACIIELKNMSNMEDDNLSRREFFKNAAKGLLPFLAFMTLPQQLLANKKSLDTPSGCTWDMCQNSCIGSCKGKCTMSCSAGCAEAR